MTTAAIRFVLLQLLNEGGALAAIIAEIPTASTKDDMLDVIDAVRGCLATMQGFADIAELAAIDFMPD